MLQAKTYLFCARPEVCFQKYTFATLQFAANTSVIRVKLKMATTNQTKREMQLLEELERMRQMIEELQKQTGGNDHCAFKPVKSSDGDRTCARVKLIRGKARFFATARN